MSDAGPTRPPVKDAKDALYVAVGLGVLGFQRAQVVRRRVTKELGTRLSEAAQQFTTAARQVQEQLLRSPSGSSPPSPSEVAPPADSPPADEPSPRHRLPGD